MKRVLVASGAALSLLSLASLPAGAAADPNSYTADGQVLNILPPGSNGNIDAQALVSLGLQRQRRPRHARHPWRDEPAEPVLEPQ